MYTCGEIARLLDLYTDGELDEPHRLMVEAHLQDCAPCSRLARSRKEEAYLIRSSDPVPALSPDFSKQVIGSLTSTERFRTQREGLLSLRTVFTRPWFAPALAGLMLLATISWAASRHLIGAGPSQIAYNHQAQAIQGSPDTVSKSSNPDIKLPADNNVLNDSAASQIAQGVIGNKESTRPDSSRATTLPSPLTTRSTTTAGPNIDNTPEAKVPKTDNIPDTGTPGLRMLSLAPRQNGLEALEQQGYAVFQPSYLPAGYSFEAYSLQPQGVEQSSNTQASGPPSVKKNLLLTYKNAQSGQVLTLEIRPLASSTLPPQPQANTSMPGNQQTGTNQITWRIQKLGHDFMLKLTGNLSAADLQKVADSVK